MSAREKHYDVVVIGAGAVGLSLAWELADRGLSTLLVERGQAGREASWAAAGMIPCGPTPAHWAQATALERLAGLSQQMHEDYAARLLELTGVDNGYRLTGALHLSDSTDQDNCLADEAARARQLEIRVALLPPSQAVEREPALDHGVQLTSAAWYADEAQVRSPRQMQALVAACRLAGVTLAENA
ncbi:MAG: FAD-dependent oxidoreductase, partial [Planctomycetales bacterium]|nr:FAD-dependent oxidoreductase [Planctomycetales bacterium]